MFYKEAMEKAESIDPDEVLKFLDDPDWEFEWFGMPGRSFGGVETYGIGRCLQDETCYAEVIDGVSTLLSCEPIVVP